jgi:hypothetical protein
VIREIFFRVNVAPQERCHFGCFDAAAHFAVLRATRMHNACQMKEKEEGNGRIAAE